MRATLLGEQWKISPLLFPHPIEPAARGQRVADSDALVRRSRRQIGDDRPKAAVHQDAAFDNVSFAGLGQELQAELVSDDLDAADARLEQFVFEEQARRVGRRLPRTKAPG